jgi:hypothetical protein
VIELFQEALSLHNLPLTAMLGMVVFYWLLVMVGGFSFDFDLFDSGADGGGAEAGDVSSHPGAGGLSGVMLVAGRVMGLSQVPLALWGSFFVLFLWIGSMILNYRYNGEAGARDMGTVGLLLIPNVMISLLLTRIITWPMARLFGTFSRVNYESLQIIGMTGVVTTVELDDRFGQIQVDHAYGAPALVMARLREPGPVLLKGDRVRVIEPSPDGNFYFVEPEPTRILP